MLPTQPIILYTTMILNSDTFTISQYRMFSLILLSLFEILKDTSFVSELLEQSNTLFSINTLALVLSYPK